MNEHRLSKIVGRVAMLSGLWLASCTMLESDDDDDTSYRLRVGLLSALPESSGASDVTCVVPDSFTCPYKLTVTQP